MEIFVILVCANIILLMRYMINRAYDRNVIAFSDNARWERRENEHSFSQLLMVLCVATVVILFMNFLSSIEPKQELITSLTTLAKWGFVCGSIGLAVIAILRAIYFFKNKRPQHEIDQILASPQYLKEYKKMMDTLKMTNLTKYRDFVRNAQEMLLDDFFKAREKTQAKKQKRVSYKKTIAQH